MKNANPAYELFVPRRTRIMEFNDCAEHFAIPMSFKWTWCNMCCKEEESEKKEESALKHFSFAGLGDKRILQVDARGWVRVGTPDFMYYKWRMPKDDDVQLLNNG